MIGCDDSQFSQHGRGITMLRVAMEGVVHSVSSDIRRVITKRPNDHPAVRMRQRRQEACIYTPLRLAPVSILFSA